MPKGKIRNIYVKCEKKRHRNRRRRRTKQNKTAIATYNLRKYMPIRDFVDAISLDAVDGILQ